MISGISTWSNWRNDEYGGIVFYGALTKASRVVYSFSVARGGGLWCYGQDIRGLKSGLIWRLGRISVVILTGTRGV